MTSTMMTALREKKVLPIGEMLPPELLARVALIVKRTFGDTEGNLVSLPFNPACGVLYANADVVPKMPETLEELEEISLKLMGEEKIKGGYTCAWPACYLIEAPAAQQDLPLAVPINGKLGYGCYVLKEANWLWRHLLDIRRMHQAGVFVYAGQTNDAKKPFVSGEVAFFMQGSTHAAFLQKEARFRVTAAPLPTLMRGQQGKGAFPLGGASLWALNNTKTREMVASVKAFLNYLASDAVQEKWHTETGYVPVLEDLPSKLKDFYKDHPIHQAVVSQTILAKLGEHSFGIHMPNYGEARKALFTLIEKVLEKDTTDSQVRQLLQEFDDTYNRKPANY